MKKLAKKETGGGPEIVLNFDLVESQVHSLLGNQLTGDASVYDDDNDQ